MPSKKFVLRSCIVLSVISWTALLVIDLYSVIGLNSDFNIPVFFILKQLLLSIFLLAIFFYFKNKNEEGEVINFLELIWRSFFTGLIATIITIIARFSTYLFSGYDLMQNVYTANLLYHILSALVIIFIISAYTTWKKLILYQKSSILFRIWTLFETSLLLSIGFNFLNLNYLDYRFYLSFSFLFVLGLIISVNLKWVAYINFKQKWQSIVLILLILCYLLFILSTLSIFNNHSSLVINITASVFILSLFSFVIIYALFSVLVIIFNLPTSSVFEQKIEEVVNFQKLSQVLQIGKKEEYAFDVLLDSSTSTVLADASWLEIYSPVAKTNLIKRNISTERIEEFKSAIVESGLGEIFELPLSKCFNKGKLDKKLRKYPFNSFLIHPIQAGNNKVGLLVLLKVMKDGFTKEMIDIIDAFVNQSLIFIENSRLISEAIKNERYKEELTIARKVQKSLLPSDINQSQYYSVSSFSEAAEEVGGDYYDIYRFSDNKTAFIIGDVSGKGTSAAFHMAQLKGIFHSLVQLDLSSREFLMHANRALSRCLEKTSFITLTFFIVDLYHHKIQLTRAGHCPALFYDSITKKVYFLNTKGLGLGIIRNSNFDNYNDVIEFAYNSNDIILLYTDGIVEAKNTKAEEYGYDRLKNLLEIHHAMSAEQLNNTVIQDLYNFCGTKKLDDDHTLVIIKFS